jgi:hypothetical protein
MRGLLFFLLCSIVVAQDFIDDSTSAPRGTSFPPVNYDAQAIPFEAGAARERPADAQPVSISVELDLLSIFDVLDRFQTFRADITRELRWYDQRFDDVGLPSVTKPSISQMGSIWTPRITFHNAREFLRPMDFHCSVFNNGTVVVQERFVHTFSSRLEVHKFPFDSQTFSVTMRSARYDQVSIFILFFVCELFLLRSFCNFFSSFSEFSGYCPIEFHNSKLPSSVV